MKTLVLQTLVAFLLVGFAAVARLVARRAARAGPYRASWGVLATVFALYAGIYLVTALLAVAAYVGGRGSAVFDLFLATAGSLNHSRTFLLLTLYGLLGAVALRAPRPHLAPAIVAGASAAAVIAGVALGIVEGTLDPARHFPVTAVLDTVGLLALGAVLVLAIQYDSMDRMLWICLALHASGTAVGIIFYTGFAWFGIPDAWRPTSWHLHLIRAVLIAAQIGVAYHRLRLEARGEPVLGLVGGPPPRSVSIG